MRRLLLLSALLSGSVAADTFSGRVIGVADGDTLTVLDGAKKQRRIRLAGIDAPERKQAFGTQSRRSLAALCLGKPAEIVTQGDDLHQRNIGNVTCAGIDANAEQVRRGMAWVSARQTGPTSPLFELEAYARLRQVGLWADPKAVAPWEWRAGRAPKKANAEK